MDIEELEIKIEYYDDFESDPLSEKNYCAQDKNVFNYNFETEDRLKGPARNIDNRKTLQPHPLNSQQLEHHTSLKPRANSITWYQAKDNDGKLLCKFCELKYSTVQTLRYHVKNKHPVEAKKLCKIIINNKRNCKHVCHICNKRFKELLDLKLHMADHPMKLVETSCMYCLASFVKPESLNDHICIKYNKRNNITYTCNICGYRTLKKSHYRQHSNTHNENKGLTCQFCDYRTNYLPNLKIHIRIHTNEKRYTCDYQNCDYKSVAKSALRSHRLKHFPKENMLFCDKCSYGTVYKQSLKKHLDSHERNFIRIKN